MAPGVEKTEVFKKGWNFANRTYFRSCKMRKHYFLYYFLHFLYFFPYFYHGIIFFSAELFACTANFKFYLNIFIFFNINTNQTSKEQCLIKKQPVISGRGFGCKVSGLQFHRSFILYGCFWVQLRVHFSDLFFVELLIT